MFLLAFFVKIKFSRKFANLQLPTFSPVKRLGTLNWNLVTCDISVIVSDIPVSLGIVWC